MELHSLYNGYIYSDEKQKREQPKHWHFWVPLICYFTGAYSDEVGSLLLNDIVTHQHIRCFQFSTHGKLQPRFVPIHPALWHAGLEDFINFVSSQKQTRLLFDLPSKTGRYSEKVRIWFSGEGERLGYLQKCGLPNVDNQGVKTAISSLRLNFEQQLHIAAIQAQYRVALPYLLGLKIEGEKATSPDFIKLKQLVSQVRVINPNASWQRFIERHN
ncbi:hypothetical protein ACSLBF_14870 [Pseudoalteromonas sp. T1lg65]|uniref:hypothetical protein n=1 Tax=Pseudoalteromonas sp. T1lg65 TaxID=2077101 RepID=UPI003F7954A2